MWLKDFLIKIYEKLLVFSRSDFLLLLTNDIFRRLFFLFSFLVLSLADLFIYINKHVYSKNRFNLKLILKYIYIIENENYNKLKPIWLIAELGEKFILNTLYSNHLLLFFFFVIIVIFFIILTVFIKFKLKEKLYIYIWYDLFLLFFFIILIVKCFFYIINLN